MSDELDKAGSFKFPEITEGMSKVEIKLETCIVLLARLCELKEDQQQSDNEKHAVSVKNKKQSTKLSLVAISLASAALYLALIETGKHVEIITILKEFFNSIKGLL
jgi:hypothetical protein